MKKYFLLFSAGAAITLASCGGETTPPAETLNVDSLAQVKVDSIAAVEKAKSDSIVAAAAKATADSIEAARIADSVANATKSAVKKTTTAAKKVATSVGNKAKEVIKEVTPPPPPPGGLKGNSDQNSTGGGLKSHSDQNKKSGGLKSHSDQNQGR